MSIILDRYMDQVRDGFTTPPGVDPVRCAVVLVEVAGKGLVATAQQNDDESTLVAPLAEVFRHVVNAASQLGLSLEQLAVADLTKLAEDAPNLYSVEALGA